MKFKDKDRALNRIADVINVSSRINAQNVVYEQEQENKRHEETIALMDRVNISKKEYLSLLDEIKDLKERNAHLMHFRESILKPIVEHKVLSAEQFQKILNNEVKIEIKRWSDCCGDPLNFKFAICYEMDYQYD